MKLRNVCFCLNVFVFAGMQTNSCMHVLIICDINTSTVCHDTTNKFLPTTLDDTNDSSILNISVISNLDSLGNGLEVLSKHVEVENTSYIIALGGSFVVNLAAMVSKDFGIPFLQYSTSKQRNPVSVDFKLEIIRKHFRENFKYLNVLKAIVCCHM